MTPHAFKTQNAGR